MCSNDNLNALVSSYDECEELALLEKDNDLSTLVSMFDDEVMSNFDEEDIILSNLLTSNCDNSQAQITKKENITVTKNLTSNKQKLTTLDINSYNLSSSNEEAFDAAFGIRIRFLKFKIK